MREINPVAKIKQFGGYKSFPTKTYTNARN